jgi:hypothetical protein
MIKRLLLAGMLAAGCAAHAWADASCTFTEAELNLSPRLPEEFRAELVRTSEARCEIEKLRPPLIEIGVAVLKDIRELERRPRGSLGEWAEPLHRRHGPSSIVTQASLPPWSVLRMRPFRPCPPTNGKSGKEMWQDG